MTTEQRLISAQPISNGIALYVAENAYLNDTALDVLTMVAKWLDNAPTIEARPVVHGRWVQDGIYNCCSACNKLTMMPHLKGLPQFNYCPNCGAHMDEEVAE